MLGVNIPAEQGVGAAVVSGHMDPPGHSVHTEVDPLMLYSPGLHALGEFAGLVHS